MDKEFQTTFIPKKPLAEERVKKAPASKPLGIFSMVATLIFVVTLLIAGGLFLFERFVAQQIVVSQESLERAEKAFEPALIIELQKLDTRLRVADTLLASHIATSPIFRILEDATLKSIQYNNFNYIFEGGQAKVTMEGLARRYQTIAEQSLLFGQDRFITDHIFSEFTLTDQGRVSFNLTLTISPELIYFERSLGEIPSTADAAFQEALQNALNELPQTETETTETEGEAMIETEETEGAVVDPLLPDITGGEPLPTL